MTLYSCKIGNNNTDSCFYETLWYEDVIISSYRTQHKVDQLKSQDSRRLEIRMWLRTPPPPLYFWQYHLPSSFQIWPTKLSQSEKKFSLVYF